MRGLIASKLIIQLVYLALKLKIHLRLFSIFKWLQITIKSYQEIDPISTLLREFFTLPYKLLSSSLDSTDYNGSLSS